MSELAFDFGWAVFLRVCAIRGEKHQSIKAVPKNEPEMHLQTRRPTANSLSSSGCQAKKRASGGVSDMVAETLIPTHLSFLSDMLGIFRRTNSEH